MKSVWLASRFTVGVQGGRDESTLLRSEGTQYSPSSASPVTPVYNSDIDGGWSYDELAQASCKPFRALYRYHSPLWPIFSVSTTLVYSMCARTDAGDRVDGGNPARTNGLVLYMDEFCRSDRTSRTFTTAQYSLRASTHLLHHLLQHRPPLWNRSPTTTIPRHSFNIISILALI